MTNVGKNRLVKKLSSKTFTKLVIYVQTFLVDTLWLHNPHLTKRQRLRILYERLQRRDNKVIAILYDRFVIHRIVKS